MEENKNLISELSKAMTAAQDAIYQMEPFLSENYHFRRNLCVFGQIP